MAGWNLHFDVAEQDSELARDCFRILRYTCTRHHLKFSYYAGRRSNGRIHFVLDFSGSRAQLGLASADFALEMRAVAQLQKHPRGKRLPLRFLECVTYSGSEEPLRLQPPSDRVSPEKHDLVVRHLTEYTLAWGSWRRSELAPPDYVEAQHSLLTNLALDLAEGVSTSNAYPTLIKALRVPERWEGECLDLGSDRNRVKHRGLRHEAARCAEKYEQCVYSVSRAVTGIDAMPRTAYMLDWERTQMELTPEPVFGG